MERARVLRVAAALIALALGLVPVFQANLLAPGDAYYFTNWDKHSQALVLSKIEQDQRSDSHSRFGLVAATPDPMSPYSTFDALRFGGPASATGYSQYASSLGLQGFAFEALYAGGCRTVNCLNTVESGTFSLVFVLFVGLLAFAVRRSLAVAVLLCGLFSPWIVSSAHNLYWVPWTWLLPAIAACAAVLAGRRSWRIVWYVGVGLGTAVKSSTGYEYITTTTLLAVAVPVLAQVLGRRPAGSWRSTLVSAGLILAACVGGFVAVFVVHLLVAGNGSLPDGFAFMLHDVQRRTYGAASLDPDPLVNESLKASVFTVLARYTVGWSTAVLGAGVGGPYPSIALGPGGFWLLLVVAGAVVAVDLLRGRARGRRSAVVLACGLLPPLSWFVLAKSHSFSETNENYVLWYLPLIPVLVWLIANRIAESRTVEAVRARLGPLEAEAP